ncbi:Sperm-associated antigen 4 protein, partial [Exophiala xenobiotica]
TSWAAGPTEYAYVLDGKPISAEEVCEGIEDHELQFVDGQDPGVCSSVTSSTSTWAWTSSSTSSSTTISTSSTTTAAAASTTTTAQASSTPAEFWQAPSSASWGAASSSSDSTWSSAQASSTASYSGGSGVDSDFPDGTLDCSTFPSQYGAISLDYLGLAGWSGLQQLNVVGGIVGKIVTGIS